MVLVNVAIQYECCSLWSAEGKISLFYFIQPFEILTTTFDFCHLFVFVVFKISKMKFKINKTSIHTMDS